MGEIYPRRNKTGLYPTRNKDQKWLTFQRVTSTKCNVITVKSKWVSLLSHVLGSPQVLKCPGS
jgi:hypothetical protein